MPEQEKFMRTQGVLPIDCGMQDIMNDKSIPEGMREHIGDRYRATHTAIEMLHKLIPVIAYKVVGNTAHPEKLRAGHALSWPTTIQQRKYHLPSDVDVLICVESDQHRAQQAIDAIAMENITALGYEIDGFVYTPDSLLQAVAMDGEDPWWKGLKGFNDQVQKTIKVMG